MVNSSPNVDVLHFFDCLFYVNNIFVVNSSPNVDDLHLLTVWSMLIRYWWSTALLKRFTLFDCLFYVNKIWLVNSSPNVDILHFLDCSMLIRYWGSSTLLLLLADVLHGFVFCYSDISTVANENNRCHLCGQQLSNKYHLKRHLQVHTGEKPYKCDNCGRSFTRKENLKTHLWTVHQSAMHVVKEWA